MSLNAKKILITTESHEVFILRTDKRDHAYGKCPRCSLEVEILTLDQAISLSGLRTVELVRLIEADEIHSIETYSGHLLVCKDSLDKTAARGAEE
jgi:hypothetical protein